MKEYWSNEWQSKLDDSLKIYLQFDGVLSKEANLVVLNNLLELSDSVDCLSSLEVNVDYEDKLIELYKVLFECSKIDSPLKIVFNSVGNKIGSFLCTNGYLENTHRTTKSNMERLSELKIAKLEHILRSATREITNNLKPVHTDKSISELRKEQFETVKNKLNEVANQLVLIGYTKNGSSRSQV